MFSNHFFSTKSDPLVYLILYFVLVLCGWCVHDQLKIWREWRGKASDPIHLSLFPMFIYYNPNLVPDLSVMFLFYGCCLALFGSPPASILIRYPRIKSIIDECHAMSFQWFLFHYMNLIVCAMLALSDSGDIWFWTLKQIWTSHALLMMIDCYSSIGLRYGFWDNYYICMGVVSCYGLRVLLVSSFYRLLLLVNMIDLSFRCVSSILVTSW